MPKMKILESIVYVISQLMFLRAEKGSGRMPNFQSFLPHGQMGAANTH